MAIQVTESEKRSIERVMSSPDWEIIERLRLEFEESKLEGGSAKRATEFDTLWYMAANEGSKLAIENFFNFLTKLAREAKEK